MPHYDYECTKCQHKLEAFQKITDKPLEVCPECKGKLKRLISSGGGVIFKGNGFYATDYKKKDKKAEGESKAKPSCSSCPKESNCPSKDTNKDKQH